MFLWTTPTGRRVFGLDGDFAERSKALAANQGLYNGFLVAGLVWGLAGAAPTYACSSWSASSSPGRTARRRSTSGSCVVQAVPALLALGAIALS